MNKVRTEFNCAFIGGKTYSLNFNQTEVFYRKRWRTICEDQEGGKYITVYINAEPIVKYLDVVQPAYNLEAMDDLFEAAWQALQALDGISKLHPKIIASAKTIPALKSALKKAKP